MVDFPLKSWKWYQGFTCISFSQGPEQKAELSVLFQEHDCLSDKKNSHHLPEAMERSQPFSSDSTENWHFIVNISLLPPILYCSVGVVEEVWKYIQGERDMLNENKRHGLEMSIPHLGQLPHVPWGQLFDPPHTGQLCTTHFQKTIYLRNSKAKSWVFQWP